MKIAIVILNWNGKELLQQFLPTVIRFSQGAEIYVADNASTDDSVIFLEQNFPTINLIRNKYNGGFAGGYNEALKYVDADLYCLLNSDVEVTETGWHLPWIFLKHTLKQLLHNQKFSITSIKNTLNMPVLPEVL